MPLATDGSADWGASASRGPQPNSVGEVISSRARQALQPTTVSRTVRDGVPLLANRAGTAPITPELVSRLRDELP